MGLGCVFDNNISLWLGYADSMGQCEMRPSHASAAFLTDAPPLPKSVKKEKWAAGMMVKGRNEPACIPRVAHAIAKIKGIPVEEICEA
jgi:TatD DNase family protein